MNRSEIDILKEVVDAIVYTIVVTEVELLTGSAKIYTCNTLYLNTGKVITIDSVKYIITEFLDNEYIVVSPLTGSTLPSVSLTEFTISNPIFYTGTPRRVQIENFNDKNQPNYQGPIIWLLNWVDILPPEDKRTSVVRSTIEGANLFFLDDCNLEDWNQEDHQTEVWKPMENLLWYVYKAIELRQDIFHRDIQQPKRRFHANFGEYLTNKGYDGTILTGAWSGVQATLDIPFIIDICDDCDEVVVCKPARFLIEGLLKEEINSGEDLNITVRDQDGNTPDYSYNAATDTMTVQTGGETPVDVTVNSALVYNQVTTNQALTVVDANATQRGSLTAPNVWTVGNANQSLNGIAVTPQQPETTKLITVVDSGNIPRGTVILDINEFLDVEISDSVQTVNGAGIASQYPETSKSINIISESFDPVGTVTEDTPTSLTILIANATIVNKLPSPTWSDTVYAEGSYILPQQPYTDSDGSSKNAYYDPATPIVCAPALNTSNAYKTGSNDDGVNIRGRGVNFYTLSNNNYFGTTRRFTGTTGGYKSEVDGLYYNVNNVATTEALAFPNAWVIDWGYWDKLSGNVIWWQKAPTANGSYSYDTAQPLQPFTVGGKSDVYIPNDSEMNNLVNRGAAASFNYAPFNITGTAANQFMITTTPRFSNTSFICAYTALDTTPQNVIAKSSLSRILFMRIGNISELL